MVIELNLYDVVKKIDGDALFGISCLQTLVLAARTYEGHSVQMNLPATVDGYLSYLEKNDIMAVIDSIAPIYGKGGNL